MRNASADTILPTLAFNQMVNGFTIWVRWKSDQTIDTWPLLVISSSWMAGKWKLPSSSFRCTHANLFTWDGMWRFPHLHAITARDYMYCRDTARKCLSYGSLEGTKVRNMMQHVYKLPKANVCIVMHCLLISCLLHTLHESNFELFLGG